MKSNFVGSHMTVNCHSSVKFFPSFFDVTVNIN